MQLFSGRGRRRALVAAGVLSLAASAIAVVAPASSASAAAAVPTPPALTWKTCSGSLGSQYGALCSFVTVPMDYDDPSAGTIKIAISKIEHTSKNYQGVILTNPGGPGGSGLDLSTLGSDVPKGVGKEYDWIGFDPRGVGASIPSIHCDPTYFANDRPDYVATTSALQSYWLTESAKYSKACASGKNDLTLLNNVTTIDSAKDMDSIRLALGQKQISYYGFSYGTYLGQVYMTMYPTHVKRAVLDSNVDPRTIWYQSNLDQDVAFTTTTKAFFAWVASHDDYYGLGSNEKQVEALYYGVLDQLRRHPANNGKVGPDEWADAFTPAGYYQLTWLDVANIFEQAVKHNDYTGVTASIEGPKDDDNEFAMYNATECTDVKWPTSYSGTWAPDANRLYTDNPFLTWSNVWYNSPCLTWPAAPHTPVKVNGAKAPPILLVDEQYDAATPIAGTFEVRSLFPQASMIEVLGGTSHAVTLFGNACTDNKIADYLASGTLPARVSGDGPDTTCKALPKPDPGTAAAAAVPAGTITRASLTTDIRP